MSIAIKGDSLKENQVVYTDNFGKYTVNLEPDTDYTFELERVAFGGQNIQYSTKGLMSDKAILDIQMDRLPGYEFQADVKELLVSGTDRKLGKELQNLRIEIFNNTSQKEIRVTEDDPKNTFEANFERGNHYTILIRKKGYYAKRVDAFVDVNDCILCFEGLGSEYAPEIEDAMEKGNERGVLVTDIPMRKIVKDEAIRLDNIYYDYDKWNIRPDARPALNDLVNTLRRNPIIIELGSHTDSRGTDEYNMTLSDKRAKSAVDYIVSRGIKQSRITSKGYGESIPLNKCVDDVKCTEEEYQFNRRTEFKVTAFIEGTNFDNKTLKQILEEEKLTNKRAKEELKGLN